MGKINYRTDDINNKLKQIDELVGSNKNLSNQINNFNSQLDNNTKYKGILLNATELGCDDTGVIACTDIVQSKINEGYSILFPKGTFKCNIIMKPKIVIEGAGIGVTTIIPENLNNDVIKADKSCYEYTIKNFSIDGKNEMGKGSSNIKGIYLCDVGELSQQDLEPHIENIKIINTKVGLQVDNGIRGGLFKNIKSGASNIGINHLSTDCIFTDCITSQTQQHGIFILRSNNTFINCKTFLAGSSKKIGAGIKNQGSYNRFINCESQQNVLENFHLQNANYNIIQGLVLDGAGYKSKDWFPNMTYQEEGGEVPISSLRLYNSNGNIIDATIIDGRIDSYCKTALFNQWVSNDKDNIIRITTNNSNDNSAMVDYILSDSNTYFNNNSITINGVLKKGISLKTPTVIDGQVEILEGGYIVDNGVCYISITLKALKTQTWGNEILSGLPNPFTTIPLSSSSPTIRSSLESSGKIIYNPGFNEGDTFTISGSYIIK